MKKPAKSMSAVMKADKDRLLDKKMSVPQMKADIAADRKLLAGKVKKGKK